MQAAAAETKTLFNITELAAGFNLNRETVAKRLRLAGIEPAEKRPRETVYRMDPRLEEVLIAADADIEAERLRKISAEADLKEMAAAQLRGELAPVSEFQEIVQALFGGLHKEIAVRFPKKIAARAARTRTAAEASALLQQGLNEIFLAVRSDFSAFLGQNGEKAAEIVKKAPKKAKNVKKPAPLRQKQDRTAPK